MEVRRQAAPGFASFSGGAQIALKGDQDLERTKAILAKDISTGYTLTFQPASTEPRFHVIKVEIAKKLPHLSVVARLIYWIDGSGAKQ